MEREYQYNYSELKPSLYNADKRVRKAETIVRVCQDFVASDDLGNLCLLDVGSSNGIIDNHLASYFGTVDGIDIDEPALSHAKATYQRDNLRFSQGDAMAMNRPDNTFDVIVCTQIYEHVPDARRMFSEIYRVLKPGGFCYFSGNNRLMLMEPHYQLPLLAVIPRPLSHGYLRITGRGEFYHEQHFTWWTLRRICKAFNIVDYSARVVAEPEKYGVDYMLPRGSIKWRIAKMLTRHARWAAPMMWVLQKPEQV